MSIAPPASGTSSRCVVVCRPRPSTRRSPVAMTSRPASALTRVDLPAPDGPTATSVAPGTSSARSGVEPSAGRDADRVDVDRERHRLDLGGHAVGVGDQVGLRQDDDRRRPRAPRQREHPLDAAEVRVGLEVLDHEDDVDVRGERLHPGRGARGVADQGGGAGAQARRRSSSTTQPVADRRREPVAVLRRDEAVPVERRPGAARARRPARRRAARARRPCRRAPHGTGRSRLDGRSRRRDSEK